jgi:hypothetical protein
VGLLFSFCRIAFGSKRNGSRSCVLNIQYLNIRYLNNPFAGGIERCSDLLQCTMHIISERR